MSTLSQLILGTILIVAAFGMLYLRKPVHACLSFLAVLLTLAVIYIQLSAEFIGVMQILVYAGAILVLFMIVIVLFQDAHQQLAQFKAQSSPALLISAGLALVAGFAWLGKKFQGFPPAPLPEPEDFGTVEALGKALYLDYFFPFEAIILLFLVAIVGALYVGRKTI